MTLLSSGYNVERDRQAEKAMLPSVAESLVGDPIDSAMRHVLDAGRSHETLLLPLASQRRKKRQARNSVNGRTQREERSKGDDPQASWGFSQ